MKWTIRRKFFSSFLVLFSIATIVFNYYLSEFIDNQTELTIENDVAKLQHTSKEYLKQFQQLHPNEGTLFSTYGQSLTQTFSKLYKHSVAIYSPDGTFVTEVIPVSSQLLMAQKKHEENLNDTSSEELKRAFNNKAAYTISHVSKGTIIKFAYPVYLHDEFYGVIRFTADYSALFTHNEQLLQHFRVLTMALFFGVFCIALLLTQQIIKPLRQLTIATKQLANRTFDNLTLKPSSDEVGQLATQFSKMQKEINMHISQIEAEKEKVLKLEKERLTLFQNVTHELKTPLTTISGYAQIIGEKDFNDPLFLQKAAQKINSESTRLNQMVNELLTFSKAQTGMRKSEVFDVSKLVSSIIDDIQLTTGQKISFSSKPLLVNGVQDEIKQVLINVIQNAVKHGEQPITVIVNQTIQISNTCKEIPPVVLQHLFEPFIHRKSKDSHGLGLFIAKQLTELNNGTLTFNYKHQLVTVEIHLVTT